MRQQAALQRHRRLVFAGVQAGVVEVDGCAGGQVAGECHVVGREGRGGLRPEEGRRTQGSAAGEQRDRQQGMHPQLAQSADGAGVGEEGGEGSLVHLGDKEGVATCHGLRVRCVRRVVQGRAQRSEDLGSRRAPGRGLAEPPYHDVAGQIAAGLRGGVVGDFREQVHGGDVGEPVKRRVGQLLRGLPHVQGGAHTGAGLTEQVEPPSAGRGRLLGLDPGGDVDHGGTDTERTPPGVLQPEVGTGPHSVLVRGARGASRRPEADHGLARVQHVPQHGFHLAALHFGQHVGQPPPEVLGLG